MTLTYGFRASCCGVCYSVRSHKEKKAAICSLLNEWGCENLLNMQLFVCFGSFFDCGEHASVGVGERHSAAGHYALCDVEKAA